MSELSAKQHQVTTLYTAVAASLDGQDLPEVYSTGIDVDAFVSHIANFKDEVFKDYDNIKAYKSQIETLESEIEVINLEDDAASKRFGVNLADVREEVAAPFAADAREALLQTSHAQGLMLNSNVMYLDAIDKKSKEMLDGWDSTLKTRKKAITLGAVLSAIDIITATGISGNAVYRLMTDEGQALLKNTTTKTFSTAVGLRGGQSGDFVSMSMNQGKFYDGLKQNGIETTDKGYEYIRDKVNELGGENSNFQTVVNRLTDYRRDKAQDWLDNDGWGSRNPYRNSRNHKKDRGWHNAVQHNPWLSVNEKQHLMRMNYKAYEPDSMKEGNYDYNTDVWDGEQHIHFAWQAHALYEWRKSDMVNNPPVTDQHWKDWVNWNSAIPENEKESLSNLSTAEWKRLWANPDEILMYHAEPQYYHSS